MTTMFIISLATVLVPIAINGAISYFRPGASTKETKAKKVELAPANPWSYADTQDPEYTAPSTWAHVDDVSVRNTAIENDNELPAVDVTPIVLTQDATFTVIESVIGDTDLTAGSVAAQPVHVDGFKFVPEPIVIPTDEPVEMSPVTPDTQVTEPPTDTPDVPPTIPPVVPVPTVDTPDPTPTDTPDPEVLVTVPPVDEPTPDPEPLTLTTETIFKKEVIVELQPKLQPEPQVYWEEWAHYEKSVIVTDFSYRYDSTYTANGFAESTYVSAHEYRANTVADYYRNSVGIEYFSESTAVSECFSEEYSLTACGFGSGFSSSFDDGIITTSISTSYNLHSETISETISEGSYLTITK